MPEPFYSSSPTLGKAANSRHRCFRHASTFRTALSFRKGNTQASRFILFMASSSISLFYQCAKYIFCGVEMFPSALAGLSEQLPNAAPKLGANHIKIYNEPINAGTITCPMYLPQQARTGPTCAPRLSPHRPQGQPHTAPLVS